MVRWVVQQVFFTAIGMGAYCVAMGVLHFVTITTVAGCASSPAREVAAAGMVVVGVGFWTFSALVYPHLRHRLGAPHFITCFQSERAKMYKLVGRSGFIALHFFPGLFPAFWLSGNPTVYRTTPREALLGLWRAMHIFYVITGSGLCICGVVIVAICDEAARHQHAWPMISCGISAAVFVGFTQPQQRRAFHAFLARLGGSGDDSEVSSAAMATLVGGIGLAEVVRLGKASFRSIAFSELKPSDFSSNAGRRLTDYTKHTKLGKCDAFLSHSWHCKNYEAKWDAIAGWAYEFRAANQHDPSLWREYFRIRARALGSLLKGVCSNLYSGS